jgi:hypothetical protein
MGAATTAPNAPASAKARARRQADALADLTVTEAEARVGAGLDPAATPRDVLQSGVPVSGVAHQPNYPNRGDCGRPVSARSGTPTRICVSRRGPIDIAALMGHRDVKTTLTVYAHLINTDDHAGNMAALGALSAPAAKPRYGGNVIPLHGSSRWSTRVTECVAHSGDGIANIGVLPHADDSPPRISQNLRLLNISPSVLRQLRQPVRVVGLRGPSVFGAPMPEAAVQEHGQSVASERDVGSYDAALGADRVVLSESEPARMQRASQEKFGPRIRTPDRSHVPGPRR